MLFVDDAKATVEKNKEEEKEKTDRMMGSFGTSIPSGEVTEEETNED